MQTCGTAACGKAVAMDMQRGVVGVVGGDGAPHRHDNGDLMHPAV